MTQKILEVQGNILIYRMCNLGNVKILKTNQIQDIQIFQKRVVNLKLIKITDIHIHKNQ